MNGYDRAPVRVGFWAVLLLGVFAWAPALYPGYWQGWEGFAPVYQSVEPSALATVGASADLWRGTGSGAFLLAQPFLRFGADPILAIRITFILAFLLGGSGVYGWLAGRVGDRGAGLAGLAYMLLPIFLGAVYVRGSVSDALVLALAPLALAGLAAYADRRSLVGASVAVLSLLWIWRIQAGLAAMLTIVLIVYALVVERSAWGALIAAVSGAAGLAALIPLWGTAAPPFTPFAAAFVDLNMLLDPGAGLLSSTGELARQPFQIGLVALIAGLFAVWGAATRTALIPARLRRLLWFSVGSAAIALLLSLAVSAPLWRVTQAERLLTYPWQMLLVVAPLAVTPLALLPLLFEELEAPAYWIALVALVVVGSLGALLPDYTQMRPAARPLAIFGDNQILLLDARLREDAASSSAQLAVTWQPLRPLEADYNVFFQALTTGDTGEQVVAQLDVQPLGDAQPPTSWRPGQVLSTTYTLDLSNAAPGEPLRYYFGYYDWRNGARLPLAAGDDKLVFYGN
jgi:hypothetical protein